MSVPAETNSTGEEELYHDLKYKQILSLHFTLDECNLIEEQDSLRNDFSAVKVAKRSRRASNV